MFSPKNIDIDFCLSNGVNQHLDFLERYVNDGSPSGFTADSFVNKRYIPTNKNKSFLLPIFSIPFEQGLLIGELPKWADSISSDGRIPIAIHPQTFSVLKDRIKGYLSIFKFEKFLNVSPTSSIRTVFYVPDSDENPHYIKCHFPLTVGRFNRNIPLYKLISSLEVSKEIKVLFEESGTKNVKYLYETCGIYTNVGGLDFGTLIRDYPFQNESIVIPAFSLFATRGRQTSLINDLLSRGVLNQETLFDELFVKLLNAFVSPSIGMGLIPEMNAQNVLFELNKELSIKNIYHRDMMDFFKDLDMRKSLDKHREFCSYHTISSDNDLMERRSFAFDFKLGTYILDPLLKSIDDKAFNINKSKVVSKIKDYVRDKIPAGYFPRDMWYRYPKTLDVDRTKYIGDRNLLFRYE